jgi:hypothetical protein
VKRVRIYFEGTRALRPSLGEFLEKAIPAARGKLRLVAGGGRDQTIDDFGREFRNPGPDFLILLVDSEEADDGKLEARLRSKGNWRVPRRTQTQHDICWMVQCMETWFIADRAALRVFYERTLHEKSLPRNQDVESISKKDVLRALKKATKGQYDKGSHAPIILGLLNPQSVRTVARHCQRLFDIIAEHVDG